ncbi:cell wall-active antibiotics response protein LiaF [Paenibacillus apis]|uniref:Cell wall-active antibiotics response protein n=1 Tax=Paenibacillus apis TaxID=1792174 RepID=A0A919Y5S1_9BACL|nr:cell wall-active antibiotics response protein LiaF [Paenibacillus apis]GIO42622.1 hypothetical protein J41TS4_23800 [Paenibacillus apis]
MRNGLWGRLIGGLVLISIGTLFLLNQLGIATISIGELFSTYWPVFLILAGLSQLGSGNWRGSSFIGSAVLMLIGGYFLARNLGMIDLSPGDFFRFFFPLLLIIGGLNVLLKPRSRKKCGTGPEDYDIPPAPSQPPVPPIPDQYIPEMKSSLDSMFDGLEKQHGGKDKGWKDMHNQDFGNHTHHQNYFNDGTESSGKRETFNKAGFIGDVHLGEDYFELRPTNISHFIGDTVIDLTKAQIPYGETKINVSAFIGDVKIFVPEDIDLGISAVSNAFIGDLKILKQKQGGFMSNVQAQSPSYHEASKRVKLIVSVFIGDVKVNTVG